MDEKACQECSAVTLSIIQRYISDFIFMKIKKLSLYDNFYISVWQGECAGHEI